jgi:hypothetical protein
LVQQRLKGDLLVPFAAGQHRRDRLSVPFGPQVQLGRDPALAAAEGFAGLRLTPQRRHPGGHRRRADERG